MKSLIVTYKYRGGWEQGEKSFELVADDIIANGWLGGISYEGKTSEEKYSLTVLDELADRMARVQTGNLRAVAKIVSVKEKSDGES